MKKIMRTVILVAIAGIMASTATAGIRCTATKSGNWSDPTVWDTGVVPGLGDDAWIDLGSNVTVDIFGAVCLDVFIYNGKITIASAGALLSVTDFFTIGNDPANTGTLVMSAGNLFVGGNFNISSDGTADITGGTLHLTGSGQNLDPGTYFNIRMSGGTKTVSGDITVDGTMEILSGATFDGGAFTHRFKGDWTNDGTYTPKMSTVIFNGSTPQAISGTSSFRHLSFTGPGIKTLSGSLLVNGDVTVGAAATVRAGSSSMEVGGNWSCVGTFNGQTGEVVFDGPSIAISGGAAFHHVTIRGATVVTCSNNITMDGDFSTSNQATFDANAQTLTVGGDWSNSGVFKGVGATIVMNGTTQQMVTGSRRVTNLTIDNSAGIQLAVGAIDTVIGTLTFTQGSIWLLNGNVHLGTNSGVVGAGAGQCIITNSVGYVHRRVQGGVSAVPFTFPVSPDATTYNPVTIALRSVAGEPDEIFAVRASVLKSGSPGFASIDTTFWVWRFWDIMEETPGGNHADLTFQWDRESQGSLSWPVKNAVVNAGFYLYDPVSHVFTQFTGATGPAPFGGPLTAASSQSKATSFGIITVGPDVTLPVQLSAFTATRVSRSSVTLTWTTLSESQNYGFYVQRRDNASAAWTEIPGSFQPGFGTTASVHHYAYTDSLAGTGAQEYRLDQRDLNGTSHYSDPVLVSGVTDVRDGTGAPHEFIVLQNYPNPFNPMTDIGYQITALSDVTLMVYDMLGRDVAVLVNERKTPGSYQVRFDAAGLPGGVYFYRIQARLVEPTTGRPARDGATDYTATKKMILLR